MITPLIYLYWNVRPESKLECAARCLSFLNDLAYLNQPKYFSKWFKTGSSKSDALKKSVSLTEDYFMKALKQPADCSDLGFSCSFWNGSEQESASFSVRCGIKHPKFTNVVGLTFPSQVMISMNDLIFYKSCFDLAIKAWDPDYGFSGTVKLLANPPEGFTRTKYGWLMYERNPQKMVIENFSIDPALF